MSFLEGTTPAIEIGFARAWDTITVPLQTVDVLVRDRVAPCAAI
jgi:hypothetical protein